MIRNDESTQVPTNDCKCVAMNESALILLFFSLIFLSSVSRIVMTNAPIVINTWAFTSATAKAWHVLDEDEGTAIDAIVEGCSVCEREQCDGTVGYGGSPDENSETTLDALLMDGNTMNVGAVAAMRNIKDAIAVARHVLRNTQHTLLVGERATEFALMMGFRYESLTTPASKLIYQQWRDGDCQPNFWTNVVPDPTGNCGPYEPIEANEVGRRLEFSSENHDTIGMIARDRNGNIAAGTSTNGARHKIPGRVGDSPIPGSGAYADSDVGAAAATGDGDVMMRFLPSYLAIELMRNGASPRKAAREAMARIRQRHPKFFGGIVVMDKSGKYAAACNGMAKFPYSVGQTGVPITVKHVKCDAT